MHNLVNWEEGDALKATLLAMRLFSTTPNWLVRQRTPGKRQPDTRTMRQTNPLTRVAMLLVRSNSLSHWAGKHPTSTSTARSGYLGKRPSKERDLQVGGCASQH